MKKALTILGIIILIGVVFFLKIVPSDAVYKTEEQKIAQNEFCSKVGCGLAFSVTPYQYVKQSLKNLSR